VNDEKRYAFPLGQMQSLRIFPPVASVVIVTANIRFAFNRSTSNKQWKMANKNLPNIKSSMGDMLLEDKPRELPVRQPISPTKSSTRLMRQISALGMEDPIFQTREVVPDHPSNIFDDMGFNDVPSDMLDLLSIASDPTAAHNMRICESSRDTRRWPSLLESCDNNSFKEEYRSSFDKQLDSPHPRLEETSHSSCTSRGFLTMRDNCAPISLSKRKIGIIHSHSATLRVKAAQYNQPQTRKNDNIHEANERINLKKPSKPNKERWNASIPSIDSNGVFSCSKRTVDSNVDHSSSCITSDSLLTEAAIALEKYGSRFVTKELIESAKGQKSQKSYNPNTTPMENQTTKEGRTMPSLSNIFPS
jgi:hypothetical protein